LRRHDGRQVHLGDLLGGQGDLDQEQVAHAELVAQRAGERLRYVLALGVEVRHDQKGQRVTVAALEAIDELLPRRAGAVAAAQRVRNAVVRSDGADDVADRVLLADDLDVQRLTLLQVAVIARRKSSIAARTNGPTLCSTRQTVTGLVGSSMASQPS